MGNNFDFKNWCDSWLTTKGINNLEPIVEYNQDHSIKSFKVKQSNEKTLDNHLRKQIMDIAVYDNDYKEHIIRDVLIDDKQALSEVKFNFSFPVKAVMLNHDDHAYAKIRYDEHTLKNLQKNF
jgi:aminopeptidase N